jgi:hypothetical protein
MSPPDRRRVRRAGVLAALALLAGEWVTPAASDTAAPDIAAAPLEPYTARYQVSYRGIAGGQIEASLEPGSAPGIWLYATRAYPNFLGRMALSEAAREHGTMQISAGGVKPLEFEFDDGTADDAKDIRLQFDWTARRVSGVANGEPFSHDIEPGTQDTASVQAAMLVELLAGRQPEGFPIVAGGRLREYRYWSEGTARVSTPAGEYDTIIWASQREGSSRLQRVWHAPALGYVPVQAIQFRNGKAELAMKLASITRP